MEKEKRKGYKTQEQQNEANQRYLEKNPDKKIKFRISAYKSSCKLFLREYAQNDDLIEIEKIIDERKNFLKNL